MKHQAKKMILSLLLLAAPWSVQSMPTQLVTYQSVQGTSSTNRIQGINLVNRFFAPYGPNLLNGSGNVFTGYGFGMSAVDALAYDYVEKYVYSKSGAGAYVTVIDYSSFPAKTTEYSLILTSYNSGLNDIVVCAEQGLLFVSLGDANMVLVFSTVKRSSPGQPKLINTIQTGQMTDIIAVNANCTVLAVANQIDDMVPAVHLITNFQTPNGANVKTV